MKISNITRVHDITPSELKEIFLGELREELIKQLSLKTFQVQQPEYLTRKEASDLFKVSLVTISQWSKIGILKPYRLGKLIRFKRVELQEALIQVKRKNR